MSRAMQSGVAMHTSPTSHRYGRRSAVLAVPHEEISKLNISEQATECTLAHVHRCVRWRVGISGEEDAIINIVCAKLYMFGIRNSVVYRAPHNRPIMIKRRETETWRVSH